MTLKTEIFNKAKKPATIALFPYSQKVVFEKIKEMMRLDKEGEQERFSKYYVSKSDADKGLLEGLLKEAGISSTLQQYGPRAETVVVVTIVDMMEFWKQTFPEKVTKIQKEKSR